MKKTVELLAASRNGLGKSEAKKTRAQKQIPAIVYGLKKKPVPIQVDYKSFEHAIHTSAGENVLIDLKVKGEKALEERVIIKEIQHDPVTDAIKHVDFNIISLTEKLKIKVRFQVRGEAPGVKAGGILDVVHHEIEVECLPTQIPDKLEADISKLEIGSSIHVRDIAFPAGVACLLSPEEVVVTIHAPRAEEEKPAEEVAKEPEVIGKGKEDEEKALGADAGTAEAKKEKSEKPEKAEKKEKSEKSE